VSRVNAPSPTRSLPPARLYVSDPVTCEKSSVSVPMLPVILGERETRRQILLYTGVLALVTIMPLLAHSFGYIYMMGAGLLDAGFLATAAVAVRDPSARAARRVFYYSMLYLALLFAVMAVDRVVG